MRTSCIQHAPKTPLVILTQDYLDICDGNHAAAIILKILEYWTDVKEESNKQIGMENQIRIKEGLPLLDTDTWIYKTNNDFIDDSLKLLKLYQVKSGLSLLLRKEFINKRNNPKFKWDRTLQYSVNIPIVQMAINNLSIGHIQPMEGAPVTNQSDTGNQAIPETTPKTTTEKESPSDFLEDIVTRNGKTSEATAPNPDDQWFDYSSQFVKEFSDRTGRYPKLPEKETITKLAEQPEANPKTWIDALNDAITHHPHGNPNLERIVDVYRHYLGGGNWESFAAQKWKDNPQKTVPPTLTEEQIAAFKQIHNSQEN